MIRLYKLLLYKLLLYKLLYKLAALSMSIKVLKILRDCCISLSYACGRLMTKLDVKRSSDRLVERCVHYNITDTILQLELEKLCLSNNGDEPGKDGI